MSIDKAMSRIIGGSKPLQRQLSGREARWAVALFGCGISRMIDKRAPPGTPDGRYIVVRGRLWRAANPSLDEATRVALTRDLMTAPRAKQTAMRNDDPAGRETARLQVEAAKQALGERGPVWRTDGAPDLNRHMAKNTPYADWFTARDLQT